MSKKVMLVGAGPGDEGLITVKGQKALMQAEVVIYDYLANPRLLNHCRPDCEKIYVGKKSGNHTMTQEGISQLMVDKARENKYVVRLKGGDPYIFGRGGEEGDYLYSQDIDFEVVPGISSSIGGLAYAGIPVTYREAATSFHVITGHRSDDQNPIQYDALAQLEGTLVFLMGIGNLENITQGLIDNGKDPKTPAAIVYEASRPTQSIEIGTLENLKDLKHQGSDKPGIIVVGQVVTKSEVLNFFDRKPLRGKNIIVTRATDQNSTFVEMITELGGVAVELPMISIKKINETSLSARIENLASIKHIVFTSQNAVEIFMGSLIQNGHDLRYLSGITVTVIGSMTAKALESYYIKPDHIAKKYTSEGLAECLRDVLKKEDTVFIPHSDKSDLSLIRSLSEMCHVESLSVYDTIAVSHSKEEMEDTLAHCDWIMFTSGSTVEYFAEALRQNKIVLERPLKAMSIGPTTTAKFDTVKEQEINLGLDAVTLYESKTATLQSMIDAVVAIDQQD